MLTTGMANCFSTDWMADIRTPCHHEPSAPQEGAGVYEGAGRKGAGSEGGGSESSWSGG